VPRAAAVTFLLFFVACAPIVRPPPPPTGFLAPPRATYGGVLTRDGAASAAADDHPATPPSTAGTAEVEVLADDTALVSLGPACALRARTLTPPYADVPGVGFQRQHEGVLAFEAGSTCAVDGGRALTIGAGRAVVNSAGTLDLVAAGRDVAGTSGSFRFTGTLVGEQEGAPPPSDSVDVHLISDVRQFGRGAIPLPRPALERLVALPDGPAWSSTCVAPCAARLEPGAVLRVGGVGTVDTAPFTLPSGRPRVVLKASGRGTGARLFGWMFLAAGASYLGIAAASYWGAIPYKDRSTGMPISANERDWASAAWVGASLAFIIPGAIALGLGRTTVTTDAGERLAP